MCTIAEADWTLLLHLVRSARRLRAAAAGAGGEAGFQRDLAEARERLPGGLARDVYLPLAAAPAAGPLVLGQVGQSLDGGIATLGGHSHYINGAAGLDHLHRLRALVDAVVVGATTVMLDDPQLTTRRVAGDNPTRVVIDPRARVPAGRRIFDGAAPSLRLVGREADPDAADPSGEEVRAQRLAVPGAGRLSARAMLDALAARGLGIVLIEGGGETLSTFLRENALDRLHVMLAPLLIGPARTAFRLPQIERLDTALRFAMTAYPLGSDVLLDCTLRAAGPE